MRHAAATVPTIATRRPQTRTQKDRARELRRNFHDAYDRLERTIGGRTNPADPLARAVFSAARDWVEYWERQATTRERALIGVLASDSTPDDVRQAILRGIHIGRQRDAKLLSPAEAALITAYREMSQAHRAIVRQLFMWAEHESRHEGGTR